MIKPKNCSDKKIYLHLNFFLFVLPSSTQTLVTDYIYVSRLRFVKKRERRLRVMKIKELQWAYSMKTVGSFITFRT